MSACLSTSGGLECERICWWMSQVFPRSEFHCVEVDTMVAARMGMGHPVTLAIPSPFAPSPSRASCMKDAQWGPEQRKDGTIQLADSSLCLGLRSASVCTNTDSPPNGGCDLWFSSNYITQSLCFAYSC